jgi:hypothetical protein
MSRSPRPAQSRSSIVITLSPHVENLKELPLNLTSGLQ